MRWQSHRRSWRVRPKDTSASKTYPSFPLQEILERLLIFKRIQTVEEFSSCVFAVVPHALKCPNPISSSPMKPAPSSFLRLFPSSVLGPVFSNDLVTRGNPAVRRSSDPKCHTFLRETSMVSHSLVETCSRSPAKARGTSWLSRQAFRKPRSFALMEVVEATG